MNKRSFIFVYLFLMAFVLVLGGVAWMERADKEPIDVDGVGVTWETAVSHDISTAEYKISQQALAPGRAVYQAPNRENQFRTYFNDDGIIVVPRTEDDFGWTWGLQLVQAGSLDLVANDAKAVLSVNQNQAIYDWGTFSEWYINDVNGLEQGFTIESPVTDDAVLALDLAITGDLMPVMVDGNNAIDFASNNGAHVLRYADLVAFDANGRILPSHMSLVDLDSDQQAIRLSVDTVAAAYPLTIDPVASTAPWQAFITEDANFGFDVSDAGDVNGDGYDDVIVGANWFDGGEANEGAAFLYYGSAAGLSQTYAWMVESDQAQAEMGHSVSTAGDINDDGYSDLIVGAPGYLGIGGAFIFLGDIGGPAPAADIVLEGEQDASKFGFSVSTAGYVNDDNFADVIVGAPYYDGDVYLDRGRAYVFYGDGSGVNSNPDWIAEINTFADGDLFGFAVDSAGDFDGNGFDDVVIGAPYYDFDGETGLVAVFPGSAAGLPNSGGIANLGDSYDQYGQSDSEFGFSVAGAGDINGDTFDDVIVGAPNYDNDSQPPDTLGAAYLYLGNSDRFLTTPSGYDAQLVPTQLNSLFGYDVDGAGDIDQDNFDDLIIGAPRYDDDQTDSGAAFVYLGNSAITWSGFDIGYFGEQPKAVNGFGTAVSTAGDVNGDGHDDFLVGAPEHVTAVSSIGQAFGYYGYKPISGLTAVNDSPALVNEAINFDAFITIGGYTTYSWDFGDSTFGVGPNPSHAYEMPGIYTATVTAENPVSIVTATTVVSVTVDGLITPGNGGSVRYTNSKGQGTGVKVPAGAVGKVLSMSFTPLNKRDLTQPEPTNSIDYYFDLETGEPRQTYLPIVLKAVPDASLASSQVTAVEGSNGVNGETAVSNCPAGHFCFLAPVTITITYNEALLPDGTDENTLTLTFWDDETKKWIDAATTCDPVSKYDRYPDQNYFTIDVCHFSRFSVVH